MAAYLVVWIYIFTVPWQNLLVIPGLGTLSRTIAMVAFGITVIQVLFRARMRPLTGFHFVGLLFMVWIGLTTFWTLASPDHSYIRYGTYLQLYATVWAMWEVSDSRRRLLGLMQAYVFGSYVAVISTLMNYFAGVGTANLRYAATGFDPNDLGGILALALPIAWYLAMVASRSSMRWLNRAYLPLAVLAILLTGSRGAMLTTVVALSVVPLTLTRMTVGLRIAAILVTLLAGVVAIKFVPESSWARLATTGSEIESGTLNERLTIWKAAIQVFPDRPLIGVGPLGFQQAVRQVLGFTIAPHNTFLAITIEEGVIGLALFLTMYGMVFVRLRRLPVRERRVTLVLLAALTVILIPLGWESKKPLWLMLALLYSCGDMLAAPAPAPLPAPVPPAPSRRAFVPVPTARRRR